MAGMALKDNYAAGFAPVLRPKMLRVLVGVDQKDSHTASLWPRSSSSRAVACSQLVLVVLMHFVLCSLRFVADSIFLGIMVDMDVAALASAVARSSCFAGDDAIRVVSLRLGPRSWTNDGVFFFFWEDVSHCAETSGRSPR